MFSPGVPVLSGKHQDVFFMGFPKSGLQRFFFYDSHAVGYQQVLQVLYLD